MEEEKEYEYGTKEKVQDVLFMLFIVPMMYFLTVGIFCL